MSNLIALIVIIAMGYWIMGIISRKKQELADKEVRQRDQFLKATQTLLKTETSPADGIPPLNLPEQTYQSFISEYFTAQEYKLSNHAQNEGIDLIGIKGKELIMIRSLDRALTVGEIKIFIADCTLHIEKNPMLANRSIQRIIATPYIPSDAGISNFIHNHPRSIQLLTLRMEND